MLESLEPEQRPLLHVLFDSPDRTEFTYLPGPRPGLALADMTAEQQARAMELLSTGLSDRGLSDARAIMRLEGILAGLERSAGRPGWRHRHPEYYWFRVLGEPGGGRPWAWKVGGTTWPYT